MAETMLGSLGIETAVTERPDLLKALQSMQDRRLCFTLRNNAYTVLVRFYARLSGVAMREELVETGHLTVHQVSYQLLNDAAVMVFIHLDDVTEIEHDLVSNCLTIHMTSADWCLTTAGD